MDVTVTDVEEFIKQFDILYKGKLSNFHHYGRVVSLTWFYNTMKALGMLNPGSVGVVSGDINELELKVIYSEKITFLNFDSSRRFDLDLPWENQVPLNFDLTVCNQVLEHVFNPHLAFKNLMHHTKPGGLIFITIPTINCIHGEPFFYSSGYHPRFLERLAKSNGLEIIDQSCWGTARFMLHQVTGKWMSSEELKTGFHCPEDFRFPNLVFSDGRDPDCQFANAMGFKNIITDCWGLFKKPDEACSPK